MFSNQSVFNSKTGLSQSQGMFVNFGLYEKVHNFFYTRRERKIKKLLEKVTQKVNVLPRGYGSLPANKNRSLNGYYNFKYASVPGNEDYINKKLFYDEQEIIAAEIYAVKPQLIKLCDNDESLIALVDQRFAQLDRRAVKYDRARKGEPVDMREINALEEELGNTRALGALASNKGLNAQQDNRINALLARAEKYLGANRTAKEKEEMSQILEELNVYLRDKEADLVLGRENTAPENKVPLAERVRDFTKDDVEKQSQSVTPLRKVVKGRKEISRL